MKKNTNTDRLAELLKHWNRATPEEKAIFLVRIAADPSDADDLDSPPRANPFSENGRYLSAQTKSRIEAVMRRRSITPSGVMQEMGFSPQDISLTLALARGSSLRLKVMQALEFWLSEQEG
ncbi:hypothetical protein [Rhizobium oryzicola]|uniref:Uncharacterized protein n=1 Tax=Rhizobium oryzicola TaxID=1232668 RepID=A0ABT8T290_9HYPH|nr:hypothetical protein [Rhizobium oryzicola]MDO1584771.1 hypothetical protein [Rhizobium oryzicola]